ncbi:hypothetical protein UlMin_003303 [Ulmus minor]
MARRNKDKEIASWPHAHEIEYLYALLDLTRTLNGKSPGKHDWEPLSTRLEGKLGKKYDQDQLKTKYTRMRKEYNAFRALIRHTGVGWDWEKETISCSEEFWNDYIKTNKLAKKYKNEGLKPFDVCGNIQGRPFPDMLERFESCM